MTRTARRAADAVDRQRRAADVAERGAGREVAADGRAAERQHDRRGFDLGFGAAARCPTARRSTCPRSFRRSSVAACRPRRVGVNVTGTWIVWPAPRRAGSAGVVVPTMNCASWRSDLGDRDRVGGGQRDRLFAALADRRRREARRGTAQRRRDRRAEAEAPCRRGCRRRVCPRRRPGSRTSSRCRSRALQRSTGLPPTGTGSYARSWAPVAGAVRHPLHPHQRRPGGRAVGGDHRCARAEARTRPRRSPAARASAGPARDAVLVDAQEARGAARRVPRRGGRDVDPAAVAGPHARPRPDAAVGADPLDDLVAAARALLEAAEFVAVEQVDVAVLADRDREVRGPPACRSIRR